jgi:acyl carrier protein
MYLLEMNINGQPVPRTKMSFLEMEKKFQELIKYVTGNDEIDAAPNSDFIEDLEMDDFDIVYFIMEVEKAFSIGIPDEIAEGFHCYGDIMNGFINFLPRELITEVVESRILCFKFLEGGRFEASMKFEDGSWSYADGTKVLPSSICVFGFSRWSNILKGLEDIVNDINSKEADLQKFFEAYPELLAGNDYDIIIPQAVIVNDRSISWKSDFVLTPKNQYEFAKILELKIPDIQITKRPHSGHVTFSAKMWNAIQQVRDYSRAFDSNSVREKFKKTYDVDIFKPDLHLIAGRKWDVKLMDSLRELQRETPVKIEDWDSVISRLRRNFT